MMMWRRRLTRHYTRRDLKCFLGVVAVLVTTTVIMLIKSQFHQEQGSAGVYGLGPLDNGAEDLGSLSAVLMQPTEQTWLQRVQETIQYSAPQLTSNITYLQAFASPYISDGDSNKNPYRQFTLSKEAKKNVTGKKMITWYAVASERLREDLFDDDVFDVCPVSKCKFVRPEMMADKPDRVIDAVIFPGTSGRELSPLNRSHPNQVFIYYDLDPPLRPSQAFGSAGGSAGSAWNSMFNWTWSYRRDADIWEPAGTLKRTDKVKPSSFYKDLTKDTKNKNKHVAWYVNTCHVPSAREKYVQELQEHVNVDIYGQCGNKTCPKGFECLEMLTHKYYFYLSFESALCKDYVTDKFFHMFFQDINVIPVVMGGADYGEFFAEGSYIDVAWFPSPKKLGEFLKMLMNDKRLYAEFLWRKSHFLFAGTATTGALCQLCHRLHDLNAHRKTYPDLQKWYRSQQCRAPRKLY